MFTVGGDELVACFREAVTEEVLRAIAARRPRRVVLRDSAFVDDAARADADRIFAELSPSTDVKTL